MEHLFLDLLKVSLGPRDRLSRMPSAAEWVWILDRSRQHGLTGLMTEGINRLPKEQNPPKDILLQWIGEVLQGYENRYELYSRTIVDMAAFYNSHGFKMMVLKGYGCSLYWPKPEHRPCGDIDIWLFGQQKDADAVLAKEKGIKIDSSHHHHTVFYWRDFMVENHYDFINIHHHKSNASLERIFKDLGKDDSFFVEVCREKVFLPSPNLNALFLLRHNLTDFASSVLSLRQILDWAFFIKAKGKYIDWEWFLSILDKYHMKTFFNNLNAICVEELGFEPALFPSFQYDLLIKERIKHEIISPEFTESEPRSLLKRVSFKYRRWKANEWKHKLCYNESMWSAFWSGVWNHLLKPSTI